MTDVSILIKTFERPESLKVAVKSIRKFYPDIKILVADDSKIPCSMPSVEYHTLPFDSGLSYGRNYLVDHCQTEYCFIIEDDMEFTANTNLKAMRHLVQGYDMVIPKLMIAHPDRGEDTEEDYSGRIVREGKTVRLVREKEDRGDHFKVDIGMNCLFGRTEYFRTHRWDDRLKVGEHQEYFIRNRPSVAQHKSVSINHNPVTNETYFKYRSRAREYETLAKKFMGINTIIGFDGREVYD